MKPPRYTDNPARFINVDLYATDLEKTFARIRKELALRERVEKSAAVPTNVKPLRRA